MKIDSQSLQVLKVSKDTHSKTTRIANDNDRLFVRKANAKPIETLPQDKTSNPVPSREFDLSMHDKSGLLQSIVSEKLTGDIIRKMPADEYLDLVSFISEIVNGSLDKKV